MTLQDCVRDRIDKLFKNGTLPDKPNGDKNSLRINKEKINDRIINISTLSIHSPPEVSPMAPRISIQTQTKLKKCKFLCL